MCREAGKIEDGNQSKEDPTWGISDKFQVLSVSWTRREDPVIATPGCPRLDLIHRAGKRKN
jgi:hypothetical protein